MSDTKLETSNSKKGSEKPQDIVAWLKKPLTLSSPTWAFAVAGGLAAIALLGIALHQEPVAEWAERLR